VIGSFPLTTFSCEMLGVTEFTVTLALPLTLYTLTVCTTLVPAGM
jgi:hypothetical protein